MTLHRLIAHSVIGAVTAFLLLGSGNAFASERKYVPPRTADGRPDLQGNWDHTDATPLERMKGFSSLVISAEQAAQIESILARSAEDRSTPTEPTEFLGERRIKPVKGQLRSSVIVFPADGRLPWNRIHQDWGAKARAGVLNAMDGPEQRPTSERCLGNPAIQSPYLYNPGTNLHQIVQTKDIILLIAEFAGEARIVRMHATHRPAAIKSWSGDSIGWWEGDTLVIETKYFTPSDTGRIATPNAFMISSDATVVERITRVSNDELNYEFSVDDPSYYSQVWRGETHFLRTNDRLLEYACHEANDSLTYILRGARVQDGEWGKSVDSR